MNGIITTVLEMVECPDCRGSGEGRWPGAWCRTCRGEGEYLAEVEVTEEDEADSAEDFARAVERAHGIGAAMKEGL